MKYQLSKISIQNFRSFAGSHELVFPTGLCRIMGVNHDAEGRSNGSGKSSLMEAVDWAITGTVARGDKASNVVTTHTKSCVVTLTLTGPKIVVIRRGRGVRTSSKTDFLFIEVDGEDQTLLDKSKTQEVLNRLLDITPVQFKAEVFWTSTDPKSDFVQATPKARKSLIDQLIPQLKELAELNTQASTKCSTLKGQQTTVQTELTRLEGELDGLLSVDWDQDLLQFNREKANKIKELEGEIESFNLIDVDQHGDHIQQCEIRISTLKNLIKQSETEQKTLESLATRGRQAASDLKLKTLEVEGLVAEVKSLKAMVKEHKDHGIFTCSTCHQATSELAGVLHSIEEAEQKYFHADLSLAPLLEALAEAKESWKEQKVIVDKEKANIEDYEAQIKVLEGQIKESNQVIQDQEILKQQFNYKVKQLKTATEEQWPNHHLRDEAARKYVILKEKIKTFTEEVASIAEELKYHEAIKTMTAAKGLPARYLDSVLIQIQDLANDFVLQMSDGQFQIKLTQEGAQEAINIAILRQLSSGAVESQFNSLSDGERQTVSLALRMAIKRLYGRSTFSSLDFFVVDEALRTGLDRQGTEKALKLISSGAGTIFIIDHNPVESADEDNVIVIEKRNNASSIRLDS